MNSNNLQQLQEQFINDPIRKQYIHFISQLTTIAKVKFTLGENELIVEIQEPIKSRIDELYRDLKDYELKKYPELKTK